MNISIIDRFRSRKKRSRKRYCPVVIGSSHAITRLEARSFASILSLIPSPFTGNPPGRLQAVARSSAGNRVDTRLPEALPPLIDEHELQNPLPGDGGIVVESGFAGEPFLFLTNPYTGEIFDLYVEVTETGIAETTLGENEGALIAQASHNHLDSFISYGGPWEINMYNGGPSQTTQLFTDDAVWYEVEDPGATVNVTFSVSITGKQQHFDRIASLTLQSSFFNVTVATNSIPGLRVTDNSTGATLYQDDLFGNYSGPTFRQVSFQYTLPSEVFIVYYSGLISGPATQGVWGGGTITASQSAGFGWSFEVAV